MQQAFCLLDAGIFKNTQLLPFDNCLHPAVTIRKGTNDHFYHAPNAFFSFRFSGTGKGYLARSSQKATALAAATFRESTPWAMGILTV